MGDVREVCEVQKEEICALMPVESNVCYGPPRILAPENGAQSESTDNQHGDKKVVDGILRNSRCCRVRKWLETHLTPQVLCPSPVWPLQLATLLLFLLLFWGASYSLLKENIAPNSSLFMLVSIVVLSLIGGKIVSIFHLPPLLGMLLVGIAVRNLGYFEMIGPYEKVVSSLRSLSMIVILIKAGLGLDAGALKRLSLVVLRLAFTPCIVEATVVMCVSHFLLDLPWLWGLLLGFVLGAVSPAVVVPSLLALKDKGYGEDKGIATLVIAASSVDDILAISGHGVVLSIIFSKGDISHQILQGPFEVLIGLSFGFAWGLLTMYIPHRNEVWVVPGRAFMVAGGSVFAVFGSQMIGCSGAGPLACIVMAFVACCGWKTQGWSALFNPVEKVFFVMWQIFEPVLFGLIGTEINLSALQANTVGLGIAVLCIGLISRIFITFLVVCGSTLNLKERLFISISWFPKATVQAALGPIALDLAREKNAEDIVQDYAAQLLTVAVLSILLTAPIGAIGIYLAGPHLLGNVEPEVHDRDVVNVASDENRAKNHV